MAKAEDSLVVVRAPRVLVFDPEPAHQDTLCTVLRAAGYQVAAVERPDSVQALSQVFRPDVVLADVRAGALDAMNPRGLRGNGLPPVLIAMSGERQLGARCLNELGADDFLEKPIAAQDLLARLKTRLKNRMELHVAADFEAQRIAGFIDPITGLYNRAFFIEMVEHELKRGARFGTVFSVAVTHVKDFRSLSARLGIERCDALLKDMGDWLKADLRDTDVVARVGTDRFAMLLPGTGDEEAPVFAARLARILEDRSARLGGQGIELDPRLGIASFPLARPRSAERFLEQAWSEMRRARDVSRLN